MATIDYMIEAYGAYSASATGGNALARDVLAGLAALYSASCKRSHLPYLPPSYALQRPSMLTRDAQSTKSSPSTRCSYHPLF